MLLSRSQQGRKKTPDDSIRYADGNEEFNAFLEKRDYVGAISLMEHSRKTADFDENVYLWLGYSYFHAGDYKKATEVLEVLVSRDDYPRDATLYLACCYFFTAMYDEAQKVGEKAQKSALQNRLLFHIFHKLKDEKRLMLYHTQLGDSVEDQLCLASIHYLRSHYQQAIDVYKKIIEKNPTYIALNVYLALCYYKLDYYDVSLEVLQNYLSRYEGSPIALNLKACNQYRLYNSKAAETELKKLKEFASNELRFAKDIIEHNTVVFRNGDTALQVLPKLVDIIPEARLNLAIYYLKKKDTKAAFSLMSSMEPQLSQEFLLKAITYCVKGVESHSKEYLRSAAEYYKTVGESLTECDTIIGRQSMASSFFLRQQFEEVLVYFNSIKTFFPQDEVFNFNYGQTLLMCKEFVEAEKCLAQSANANSDNKIFNKSATIILNKCLARAYIKNGKANSAWTLYNRSRDLSRTARTELLQIIANDCYKTEEFVVAARAFDELEKTSTADGEMIRREYAHARRCACAGVVQMFSRRLCALNELREVIGMLENERNSAKSEKIAEATRRWAEEINVYF